MENLVFSNFLHRPARTVVSILGLRSELRPEFLDKFENFIEIMIERYLKELTKKSIVLNAVPKPFKLPRDPDDDEYINLAIESKADYIITRDKDLVDLMVGYDDTSKQFR